MRRHFFILCLCMMASLSAMAQPLRGTWNGELETGAMKLPIVIHLDTDSQGQTVCTMDSPNQGAKGERYLHMDK